MSKADEPAQPTEEQIQAANEAEEARWQGDFNPDDLKIPYKREEDDASKDDESKGAGSDNGAADKGDGTASDTDVEEPVEYATPEPVVTVDDPGEYKPADYSFEVTLKDGKTKKITTPEQAAELAEDPDNFETPKQLLDFINKTTSMTNKLEKDKDKYDAQKKQFDEQTQTQADRQELINDMTAEFDYLVSKKLMPAIDKQYLDADWSDPEVAKQSGVKEQIELLNYMVKENEIRAKAKVKPITSIVDAFNAWQLDSKEQKAKADEKAAGQARKDAGARVAGVSPSQQGTYVPKGIAVGNPNVFKRGAAVWDN